MGCIFTHPRQHGDVNLRLFKVLNMDKDGQERNPGKIEITESELVFHQKYKEPIRWPLRSLRRYGFDSELFSFESGRRCPTGPGIYAFKCSRAEALFNLLQECIQRAGQHEDTSQRPPIIDATQRPMSVADLHPDTNNQRQSNAPTSNYNQNSGGVTNSQSNGGVVTLQAFPQISSSHHEYINADTNTFNNHNGGFSGALPISPATAVHHTSATSPSNVTLDLSRQVSLPADTEPQIQYAELDLGGGIAPSGSNGGHISSHMTSNIDSSHANYMNLSTNGGTPRTLGGSVPLSSSVPLMDAPLPPVPEDFELGAGEPTANYLNLGIQPTKPKVTYIEVEFNTNNNEAVTTSSSSSTNATKAGGNGTMVNGYAGTHAHERTNDAPPTPSTESYAVIDFNKTAAINTKNTTHLDDEGARKTRHNSNIELP